MNEETPGGPDTKRVPVMQKILDNPFILLFIGVVFPTVFYIVWASWNSSPFPSQSKQPYK